VVRRRRVGEKSGYVMTDLIRHLLQLLLLTVMELDKLITQIIGWRREADQRTNGLKNSRGRGTGEKRNG
jgi:hypothetical protein